jgi:hypothetical protein
MRSENAMMPSRREVLSDALGIGLVTTSTWSIRDGRCVLYWVGRVERLCFEAWVAEQAESP